MGGREKAWEGVGGRERMRAAKKVSGRETKRVGGIGRKRKGAGRRGWGSKRRFGREREGSGRETEVGRRVRRKWEGKGVGEIG